MSIASPSKRQVAHAAHIQGLLPQNLHFPRTDLPSLGGPRVNISRWKQVV